MHVEKDAEQKRRRILFRRAKVSTMQAWQRIRNKAANGCTGSLGVEVFQKACRFCFLGSQFVYFPSRTVRQYRQFVYCNWYSQKCATIEKRGELFESATDFDGFAHARNTKPTRIKQDL